jgi:hypothetical protein
MMKKIIASILLLLPVCAVAMDRSPIMKNQTKTSMAIRSIDKPSSIIMKNKTKSTITIQYPEEQEDSDINRKTIKPGKSQKFPIRSLPESKGKLFTIVDLSGFKDTYFIVNLSSNDPVIITSEHAKIKKRKPSDKTLLVTQGKKTLATFLPEKHLSVEAKTRVEMPVLMKEFKDYSSDSD